MINFRNGSVVDVSGQSTDENWISAKFVFKTMGELTDDVKDFVWMPKY